MTGVDEPLRVALASPSPLVLAGLRSGLERHGAFDITIARDSLQALRDEGFGAADVAIVDIDGEAAHGAAPASEVIRDAATPPLVLLVAAQSTEIEHRFAAGSSLVPRHAPFGLVAAAAQAAAAGLVAVTPLLARRLQQAPTAGFGAVDGHAPYEALTPREREVLQRMSLGLANREIADALNISAHTAKFHVGQIIAKLAASSRAHAVAKAMRAGLVAL